jgi:threonine dehydrogenase-like Zn-dependent dehydrogenase
VFVLGIFAGKVDKFPMGALMIKDFRVRGAAARRALYCRVGKANARRRTQDARLIMHSMPLDQGAQGYDFFKFKKDGWVRAGFQA